MEKIVEQGLLYDFYGILLTDHQQKIYEEAVYQDWSLSEIAEEEGISRQGVHDLLKRCNKILQEYEDKLHLIERFEKAKSILNEICELTVLEEETKETTEQERWKQNSEQIRELSQNLIEEL